MTYSTPKAEHIAARAIDRDDVDSLLLKQMYRSPRSFNFSDDEVAEIERAARKLPMMTGFARTVQIALDRGFIRT